MEDSIEYTNRINTLVEINHKECSHFLPLPHGSIVYVSKVYDGDSVTICFEHPITGENVKIGCRVNGIDTPELRGSSDYEKELAYNAKDRMSSAVLNKFVTIINPDTEKYGRVLCDLKTDTIDSIAGYMLEDPTVCRPYTGGKKKGWDPVEN